MTTATELEARSPRGNAAIASIRIEGMTCASCVGRVEKAIRAVPGVAGANVNLATARADVSFAEDVDPLAIVGAIKAVGYKTANGKVELSIGGMTCASCVGRIEKALKAVPGVIDVSANLASERASIRFVQGAVPIADLESAVRRAGYEARTVATGEETADREVQTREREMRHLRLSFGIAAILSFPIVVLEMGAHLIPTIGDFVMMRVGTEANWYLQFALASFVLFGPGLRFFKKGVPSLLRGSPDMNSLVALGTSAAWGYSVIATFLPGVLPPGTANVYYEAAAVIVTLVLLGRFLEARAKGRTGQAIKRLMGLAPKTGRAIRDGEVVEIPLDQVEVGDLLLVRPGDQVAVDGEVVDGSSFVDESMISGEPVPVQKAAGAEVVGGTINKTGSFTFRATKVGAATVLAQIIHMVEQAQGSKLPIQALVDRVTTWFVPVVIVAAAATLLVWLIFGPSPALALALVNAVAVLIIACPCAMGLATPTSIMVGTGRAAEMGVLFRKGEALQTLRDVKIIALDKTGTLTKGRPELTDLVVTDGFNREELLALVAAVEKRSEHPIGEAMVEAAKRAGSVLGEAANFEAIPGFGVKAHVDGHIVNVGAARLMANLGLDVSMFHEEAGRLSDEGKSPLYAAVDGRLAAIIAVADPIKASTAQAIAALHDLGLKVAMITGDNRRTAEAIGRQLGIDKIVAEVLPDGKVAAVRRMRANQRTVAFVGDGINDAPALAEADVGLAIGTGTDVAIESADIVLVSGDLRDVASAIALSKATIRNIKQNLFWAFAYNTLLIPIAAGALYPVYGILLSPIFAAGAMGLSSVFVLGNALRLRGFRPPISAEAAAADRGDNRAQLALAG